MKKILSILVVILISSFTVFGQQVVYQYTRPTTQTVYRTSSVVEKQKQIGIITRFGYSFADYFDYGASLFYKFNPMFGIIVGVDGASKVHFSEADGFKEAYQQTVGGISQWDVRAGAILGKYLGVGAIYGNCLVCTAAHKEALGDAAFEEASKHHCNNNIHDLGGFVTILLPINDYIGLNVDVAYTTHTYFNISGGIIISLPLKK